MKRILSIIAIVSFCAVCFAQTNVLRLPLDSGKTIKGSTFCYMLPTTSLKVTVNVTKVREIKGYYADYAESLLGLKNVISENRTFYKIKDINIEPVVTPDATESYLVQLSGKQLKDNYLTKLSAKPFDPNFKNEAQCFTTYSAPIPDFFKNYSDPTFTEMEDSFVETKIIDGVVTQVPSNRTKLVSKSNNQKAQEAADLIGKSRKSQYSLVAGEQETAYSAEALNNMLAELKQWENNYLSLFTGLILEDELTYTFYVDPTTENGSFDNLPIFSFDANKGLSINEDHTLSDGNNSYTLFFEPVYTTNNIDEAMANAKQVQKSAKRNGYFYRKPMPVKITLKNDADVDYNFGIFNMYQFGRIQTLAPNQDTLDVTDFGFVY